jgi:class 3 adenylate cyclase
VGETKFAELGRDRVAYQVLGDGPDLVLLTGTLSHVDVRWGDPQHAQFLRRLASFSRLILLDPRGCGASDPIALDPLPTWEDEADDLGAVLDAVGSSQATVFASSDAGPPALFYAATHPERVRALILANTTARYAWAEDYPIGLRAEEIDRSMERLRELWGTEACVELIAPSQSGDPEFCRWLARYQRAAARPREFASYLPMTHLLDVRGLLPSIRCSTLVLQRTGFALQDLEHGRYLAQHIEGARFVEIPGRDGTLATEHVGEILDLVEEFLTGSRRGPEVDRVLATVLFTDIVGSTARAAAMGDREWLGLLDRYYAAVRREVARLRGREIDTAGDGFFITFDGPARAIRCAAEIRRAVRALGLEVRTGIHAGECEVAGDKVAGIAVHVGARIVSLAGAGEILVSSTVRDLVTGSGLEFVDRGSHELKGVPGEWRLFAASGVERS